MPSNLTMPRLSDTMEQGTIVKWHVKPGQKVKSGDVIADIETDKATMELQTFEDGVVGELAVPEAKATPVGMVILRWEGGTESAGKKDGAQKAASAVEAAPVPATVGSNGNGRAHTAPERVFASPLARKIAADSGVDLGALTGSGPSGRIIRRDVEAAMSEGQTGSRPGAAPSRPGDDATPPTRPTPAQPATAAPAPTWPVPGSLKRQMVPLSNMRRTIATRLVESKTTVPHYQVTVTVRADALLSLRSQLNEQLAGQGVKLSVNDFIVRACALAMYQHPFVNSRWVPTKGNESIELLDRVNIGVAISLPMEKGGGLLVATLRDADAKGLRQISADTRFLADKARGKGLTIEEMSDSTFTISNLGMFGVEHFTAIINPPNVAILAVGAAVKKPVVVTRNGADQLEVGHEMQMTMSSDHRVVDGAMAAAYLATVKGLLEKPATLLV